MRILYTLAVQANFILTLFDEMSRKNIGRIKVQRMKKLTRLSLKEEVEKEARQTEKEAAGREDLAGIIVSEEMENALFDKIRKYDYDRKTKRLYPRKKRRYVAAVLAAVLVLVFGSTITSVGSKSYWKVLWEKMIGDERVMHIDVEKMDSQETEDVDEIQAYREIRNELGISAVRFGYAPSQMYLKAYELDRGQNKAVLMYEYEEKFVKYTMYMNDEDSSFGQIEPDAIFDQYEIKADKGISIQVKEYKVKNEERKRYIAEFQYMDAQYELKGDIEKKEFDNILKNLIFYK